jgi:hypothetical protein
MSKQSVQETAVNGAAKVFGWVVGFVIAAAVVGGIRSWWSDNHYSSDYDNAFLSSCEAQAGANASYCGCALKRVHEDYTPKEASALMDGSHSIEVQAIASYCLAQ